MNDNEGIDLINILSFLISLENLSLNNEQIQYLDKHLQSQDFILKEQQNKMLEKIIEQNEEIIKLLKNISKN